MNALYRTLVLLTFAGVVILLLANAQDAYDWFRMYR